MLPLIVQLFTTFLPIYQDIAAKWKAAHAGAEPTDADVLAQFEQHYAQIISEGQNWKDAHPHA